MRAEYFLFNVIVFALPFGFGLWRPVSFRGGRWAAFVAAAVVSVPYLIWDALVAGHHWSFNPKYTLGIHLFGLPIEEVMFFFTVPFACMYTWEMFFVKTGPWHKAPRPGLAWLSWLWLLGLPLGLWALAQGKGYTGLMLLSLSVAALFDRWAGLGLLQQWRTYVFLLMIFGFTLLFNGYLTARPVVLYDVAQQLNVRLWTVPLEDFGYGISLVLCNLVLYQRLRGRIPATGRASMLHGWIEKQFDGYKHRVVTPDEAAPYKLETPRTVAVIGGGLAGMRAAMSLSERGFRVTIFEKNDYLGGKVGSWTTATDDGETLPVSHGFHAFFRHYYNLNQMIEELGCRDSLVQIDDYLILEEGGQRYSFKEVATPPVVNLLSLAAHGIYNLREVALSPAGQKMESFLRYDAEKTYRSFDHVSFEQFSNEAKLPHSLQLIFNSFSRAFFADPDRMSMAALIESFHFYYLSHDHGLLYDYFDDDYEDTLLKPFRDYVEEREATIKLSTPVSSFGWREQQLHVNDEAFDYVVLAADIVGSKKIVADSEGIAEAFSDWYEQMDEQRSAQGYSVWRLWIDRDLPTDLSPFFITDREHVLDAVAIYHRLEKSAEAWVEGHGGGVIELHCYAVPDGFEEAEVRAAFLKEFFHYFPDMRDMTVVHESFQLKRDFSAYHVGMDARRPGVKTPVPGLFLAGDWVKLPYPAMLMEAACMSGLLSANEILAAEGLRLSPVDSVPQRGILTGMPAILDRQGRS